MMRMIQKSLISPRTPVNATAVMAKLARAILARAILMPCMLVRKRDIIRMVKTRQMERKVGF